MKNSVIQAFPSFTTNLEGNINWMYLDVKGLVTTGKGNLIDPVVLAVLLPFMKRDSSKATRQEIVNEWQKMKTNTYLAKAGANAAKRIASLFLAPSAVDALVLRQLLLNEKVLVAHFPEWNSWPADAQLGVCSMAWAMGPEFVHKFPRFAQACKKNDWKTASLECTMNTTNNPGLVPRNHLDRKLFECAAHVIETGLDSEVIWALEPTS